MTARLGDAERDRHRVEERRLRQDDALRREIGGDVEGEGMAAGLEVAIRRQCRAAAVGVGDPARQQSLAREQPHRHPRRRPAVCGVEDVGGQAGHTSSSAIHSPVNSTAS